MALTKQASGRWWSRLHFLVRLAGLTGLLAAGLGLALAYLEQVTPWDTGPAFNLATWDAVRDLLAGESGSEAARVAAWLTVGGVGTALLALLVEVLAVLRLAAGRRSAFGTNALIQIAVVVALVAAVNAYAFRHYLRFDWTRDRQFTLSPELQDKLRQVTGKTTIVVYQQHKTFGQLSDKPNAYDYAAERKVVEKVQDLVDEFRELGPQFDVHVLDVEEEGFADRLADITRDAGELRQAIDAAPENSIFFYAKPDKGPGRVQRLSFNQFYQLDKKASGAEQNLVLLRQGADAQAADVFARKVLNVDQRPPRVVVATVLEPLSTKGPEPYGLRGVQKALASHGVEVHDIILKRIAMPRGLEPAAYTYDESRLNTLESRLRMLTEDVEDIDKARKSVAQTRKLLGQGTKEALAKVLAQQSPLAEAVPEAELAKQYLEKLKEVQPARIGEIRGDLKANMDEADTALRKKREQVLDERAKKNLEHRKLNREELAEQRRMTDVGAKLDHLLADCDLLILPRHTVLSIRPTFMIANELHQLDPAQVKVIRDYLRAGKPMLACFGPANDLSNRRRPPGSSGPDGLEDLLAGLGIRLGPETVLFNVQAEALAGSQEDELSVPDAPAAVPRVSFDLQEPAKGLRARLNAIGSSLRVAAHSTGQDLNLEVRYPRPVYYTGDRVRFAALLAGLPAELGCWSGLGLVLAEQSGRQPEFMMTSAESWKQADPLRGNIRPPLLPTDPRHGPIPIGVAVESPVPATWADKDHRPTASSVRVAAIGHGGWFVGDELSPTKERLLLDVSNWLLRRDELLVTDTHPWRYPRVALEANEQELWHWGVQLGLPGLFVYLGLAVLMVRRLR
jgi:hypothetical protein